MFSRWLADLAGEFGKERHRLRHGHAGLAGWGAGNQPALRAVLVNDDRIILFNAKCSARQQGEVKAEPEHDVDKGRSIMPLAGCPDSAAVLCCFRIGACFACQQRGVRRDISALPHAALRVRARSASAARW